MAPQMSQIEKAKSPTRTAEVQQEVNDVIGIMHTNIEKVVMRGEKIESLQSKTDELQMGALSFKKTSNEVKNNMCKLYI